MTTDPDSPGILSRGRRPALIGVSTSELRLANQVRRNRHGEPARVEMALGMSYLRAVERAGGLPVVLPPLELDRITPLLDRLSGVLLSGGPDLDPAAYGRTAHPELGPTEPQLDLFEVQLARAADARGLPILGICRGAQALNIARGGTLHQHLPEVTDGSISHRQSEPGDQSTHNVRVATDSRLASALGSRRMAINLAVNSFHHQSVEELGRDLHAVAWADDGVIEGIEGRGESFVLGVQWHAETLVEDPAQLALFQSLVSASEERERARPGRRTETTRRAA
jgi:putative glutamine amidotransferase